MTSPNTGQDPERKPESAWAEVNPFTSVLHIGPANRDHEVAIRCTITVIVPLLVLLLTDRLDLVVFVSFAAFPGIYGRNLEHGPRLRMQLRAGVLMFATLIAATIMARLLDGVPGEAWIAVLCTSVMAALSALVAQYWQLRPGGAIFNVFAFGAVVAVPQQPMLWEAALATFVVIAWAVLMGGVAAGAAGCVSLSLSQPWNIDHTYWAQLAAVVPLAGHTTKHAVNRGFHRIIGTFLGLFGTALILWLALPVWALILVIALLQGLTELFVLRSYVLGQVFVTPLALVSIALATVGSGGSVHATGLVYDRFIETVIGSLIGVVVVLVPWVVRRRRRG